MNRGVHMADRTTAPEHIRDLRACFGTSGLFLPCTTPPYQPEEPTLIGPRVTRVVLLLVCTRNYVSIDYRRKHANHDDRENPAKTPFSFLVTI